MHPYVQEYFRRLRLLAWNETEQRPRAFIRISLFFVSYTIVFVAIPFLIVPSSSELLRASGLRLILALCAVGLLFGATTFLDRRPVQSFGLRVDRRWIVDGVAGSLIGLAIPTATTLIGLAGGWLAAVEPEYIPIGSFLANIGLAIIVTVCIAIVEEIVFRGYILTNTIEGLDLRWLSPPMTIALAWAISALLFAFTHATPTLVDGFHFLGAGLLLGLAYLLTGQLGLPIGLHAGLNFGSGYVFSTTQDPSVAVFPLTVQGSSWLIGQTGLVQTSLQILAAFLIVIYVRGCSGSVSISPAIKTKIANGDSRD